MEKFIKRYLTPSGRFRVASDLIEKRYFRMLEQAVLWEQEITEYISQMGEENFKKTRFYFYHNLYTVQQDKNKTFLSFGKHKVL